MEKIINNGQCPECEMKGIKSMTVLNTSDYWECPVCHLQLQLLDDDLMGILNFRGEGKLKDNHYKSEDYIKNRTLLRRPLFDGDDCIIKDEEELQEYINIINGQ